MSDSSATSGDPTARIARLVKDADDDTQSVIKLALAIEQTKLYQRERNKSGMAKELAEQVRRTIK